MALMTCKQCGNQIPEEADKCPDCGLRKEPSKIVAAPSPPPPSAIKQSPVNKSIHPSRVLVLLREMLTSSGLVRRIDFESVLLLHPDASVDDFTHHLQEERFLTAPQRKTLLEQFKTRQMAEANKLLTAAIARGLLQELDRSSIMVSFSNVLYQRTIIDHLVEDGRITSSQAEVLAGKKVSHGTEKIRASGRLVADAVRRTVKDRPRAVVGAAIAVSVGIMGVAVLFFSLVVWWAFDEPLKLEPNCTMDGNGRGQCTFSNTADEVGSGCGRIYAYCGKLTDFNGVYSATLCSGKLQPQDTKVMPFQAPGFDRLSPNYGDWRDSCSFHWSAPPAEND